jgi:two-component system nitrogen regulation response regulator GlnG
LPLELQPKLLRVLENGEYQRVGETQTRQSQARVIAATNRDLKKEVKAGRFRADLFHRLSVFTVSVPPVRDRDDDRLLLLEHFRRLYAEQAQTAPFTLDAGAEALWRHYAFPGNVRELRNIVIRLTAKHPGRNINAAELAPELDNDDDPTAAPTGETALSTVDLEAAIRAASQHLQQHEHIDLDAALALWERSYIEAALQLSQGNITQAARRLGINRTTLYNRMEGWSRS